MVPRNFNSRGTNLGTIRIQRVKEAASTNQKGICIGSYSSLSQKRALIEGERYSSSKGAKGEGGNPDLTTPPY